jgi:hypothetical protein
MQRHPDPYVQAMGALGQRLGRRVGYKNGSMQMRAEPELD